MPLGQLAFHLTDRCRRDCLHCLRDPGKRPLDLSPELIGRVLAQGRDVYGCRHAGLTGGDPLLHPRLAEVLDTVVREGFTWHVVTSGDRFRALLDLLAADPRRREALTVVNLSLDGPTEAIHDAIRGPGSFREVTTAATLCKATGLRFTFQLTVHARNVAALEEMGLAAAHLGAERLMFGMTQPTGTPRDRELHLSPAAWRAAKDRIARLAETLKLPVGMAEGFPEPSRFHVCHPARMETLHVDPQGRLNLCCQLSGVPGDERDVVADLAAVDLVEAHRRLLDLVHEEQRRRLEVIAAGPGGPWDAFPCNECLRSFGKPHWTEQGSAGPAARRERWPDSGEPPRQLEPEAGRK